MTEPTTTAFGTLDLLSEPMITSQEFSDDIAPNASEAFDLDCLFDIMWDTDGNDMRRQGLSEESIFMLSSPENVKSKKIYENHQKKFLKYALSTGQESFKEETMVNYFTNTYKEMTYSPGSFWQMFSCIRSYVLVKTKIDIKSFTLLKKLIKSLVVKHLVKKASIFTSEEIVKALKEFYDDSNPKDLANKISVSLAYYGLLRLEEVITLKKKDIVLDLTDDIEVNYPYSTKRSAKGFSSSET